MFPKIGPLPHPLPWSLLGGGGGAVLFVVSVLLCIKPASSAQPVTEPKSALRKGSAPRDGHSLHHPDLIIVTSVAS